MSVDEFAGCGVCFGRSQW